MKAFSKKLLPAAGIVALGALTSPMALAAAVDVAEVVSEIKAQLGPIAAVGGGILLVVVTVKVYDCSSSSPYWGRCLETPMIWIYFFSMTWQKTGTVPRLAAKLV